MSTDTELESSPVENIKPPSNSRWPRFGLMLSLIGLAICIIAFALGYFSLARQNLILSHHQFNLTQEVKLQGQQIVFLNEAIQKDQASLSVAKDLSSQQAELLKEWRAAQAGDLTKWKLAEAFHLVKRANEYFSYASNIELGRVLLNLADVELSRLEGAQISEIRQSIAADLAHLPADTNARLTELYVKIVALNKQVDELPLPESPLATENDSVSVSTEATGVSKSWWQVGLSNAWKGLSKIVVIHKNDSNTLPLVLPTEKVLLTQNLHAKFSNLLWAVLHQNNEIYQSNLQDLTEWTKLYFVQDAPFTEQFLANLKTLQASSVAPIQVDLTATLKLFADQLADADSANKLN